MKNWKDIFYRRLDILGDAISQDRNGIVVMLTVVLVAGMGFGVCATIVAHHYWPHTAAQSIVVQKIQQSPIVCCLGQLKTETPTTPANGVENEPGEHTVLAAMKLGENCLLPKSVFHEWEADEHGEVDIPDETLLLIGKDTCEICMEFYLPLDMPVSCTAQAPIPGRPYIRKVKGPNDTRAWFQIRGAEQLNHYSINSWDNIPADKQHRLVEVSILD